MREKSRILTRLFTLTLLTSVACFADVISTFSIAGSATVSATSIDFSGVVATINTPSDPENPLVGSAVNIGNLSEATTPVNTPIDVTDWLTTTTSVADPAAGEVSLNLMLLPAGVFPTAPVGTPPCGITDGAPGNTCTPTIVTPTGSFKSNLNLFNTASSGYTAGFFASGSALDKLTGTPQFFTAEFAAADTMATYQSALAQIAAGGSVTIPFTAKFSFTAIPEPSFLPLFGIVGILVVGVALYRRRSQRA
jgi:hypothetical protein